MTELEEIRQQLTSAMQRLDALEQKPQEIPPVWFKPEGVETFAVVSQNGFGKWTFSTEIGARCTHPVLHPYHAARYCEAMNTLALLRAESDKIEDWEIQWGIDEYGSVMNMENANTKYVWCGGIVKKTKEALLALLQKHNVTPETVAKMLRFVNGDKTAGDW